MNLQPSQRHLPLAGTYNLRDLGGYPTQDRKTTRWRTFFRCDGLHRLSPVGQQALIDLGLRSVIDLRFPFEVQNEPNVFVGKHPVRYHHISLMSNLFDASHVDQKRLVPSSLEVIYCGILNRCQGTLRTIFEVMSDEQEHGIILFHCTAGKDRTGLIAALLLGLAGVEPTVIAEDYALTDRYLTGLKQELRAKAAAVGEDMAHYERMLESKPEAMCNTLAYIERKYGGVRLYLQQIGLVEAKIDALREALVES
ncbi:MAG: tyrosine-protein phosphatase [Caldilineaceae bacterium]